MPFAREADSGQVESGRGDQAVPSFRFLFGLHHGHKHNGAYLKEGSALSNAETSPQPKWYALYTKPQKEQQVAEQLALKDVPVFLPMIPVRRHRRNTVDRPLFPRYLFAQLVLDDPRTAAIRWTPGLVRFVAFGERPVAIPDEVIAKLRERVAEFRAAGGLPTHNFHPGDRVLITNGPLKGLEAVFQGPMRPSDRVKVLVEFLGQLAEADVAVEDLRRVPRHNYHKKKRPRRTRGRGRRIRRRGETTPPAETSQ
ncbi:MAG: hypothetical protein J7M34_13765 [Anaerolineae bacterium]|nr:hypothetical protein [Anaerolineae bacterium]